MAEGYAGKDFLLKLGTSSGGGTVPYTAVGGMRTNSLSLNNEAVEVTNKGNMPWRQYIDGAGVQSMTLSGAGVWNDDATLVSLMSIAMTGDTKNWQLTSGEGDTFTGRFKLTKLERSGEFNGEETYTITLESNGVIAFVDG